MLIPYLAQNLGMASALIPIEKRATIRIAGRPRTRSLDGRLGGVLIQNRDTDIVSVYARGHDLDVGTRVLTTQVEL